MTSQYKNARLLLLGGSLEFQGVSSQLESFDILRQQVPFYLLVSLLVPLKVLGNDFANLSCVTGNGSSKDGCFKNRGPSNKCAAC